MDSKTAEYREVMKDKIRFSMPIRQSLPTSKSSFFLSTTYVKRGVIAAPYREGDPEVRNRRSPSHYWTCRSYPRPSRGTVSGRRRSQIDLMEMITVVGIPI